MVSTILSSLGEPILHCNSLATITSNWVVVRQGSSGRQSVVALQSISELKPIKSIPRYTFVSAFGCFLLALAAHYSNESEGSTLPFALLGFALFASAVARRQVALAFVVSGEAIQTLYGSPSEAAALLATFQTARSEILGHEQNPYSFYSWLRAYLSFLV
jgi:hypothetical protein